jgi:sporulation protein YlmC with PRC-barrel domain
MDNKSTIRKWSDIYNLAVTIPSEGKTAGIVQDFYFKAETNAVYALLVHTRLSGDLALPVIGIKNVGTNAITIPNEEMLLRALPPLPQGKDLRGSKVVSEDGAEVGTIGEVWLAVDPPISMHIVALELAGGHASRSRSFSADDVVRYAEDNIVVIYDRIARRLR